MAIWITGYTMVLEIDNRVVAAARFSEHAAADGNGAWTVSTCPARLFNRDQAMTALMVVELSEVRLAPKSQHAALLLTRKKELSRAGGSSRRGLCVGFPARSAGGFRGCG
jgi:hypothetical protein